MNVETIYEKKYPAIDLSLMKEARPLQVSSPLKYKSFHELMDSIQANTIYSIIPERVSASENFIQLAIEYSELYEIDIRIECYLDRISVNYSFDCCGCLRGISRVFGMADQISFFTDIFDRDITVVLDFFTHSSHRKN